MRTSAPVKTTSAIKSNGRNWRFTGYLPRDKTQSHRLHEPARRINTIDPITGVDIDGVTSHPSLVYNGLTLYFESKATRRAYIEMPLDHPNLRLPYPATDNDDRGG